MKKVFRIWKFIESMNNKGNIDVAIVSLKLGWPQMFEGKTQEEMNKKGYMCSDSWIVKENLKDGE